MLTVAFLDIFHGDCSVITFNEGGRKACIVVDGGEDRNAAKRLVAYLKNEKVEVIDLLVATHIDSDHVNGLVHFLKSESGKANSWNKGKGKCIRYYWGPKPDPDWTAPSKRKVTSLSPSADSRLQTLNFVIQSVAQNQELNKLVEKHILDKNHIYYPSLQDVPPLDIFNSVKLEFLAPDIQILDSEIQATALTVSNLPYAQAQAKTAPGGEGKRLGLKDLRQILALNAEEMAKIANRNANNQSIVFRLTPKGTAARKWTFLFTGDAEEESWEMMRQMPQAMTKLSARVLKVPHHGSVNGINEAAFRVINPEYNIISVGQKHGLPDGQTLNLIKRNKKRKLFCTERNNSQSHPGPCRGKKGCLRKTPSDFRSIRFSLDADSGGEKIDAFLIDTSRGEIKITGGGLWCPENIWEV